MKILIIGGSGVIGYNLLQYFLHEKIDVEFTYFKNKIPTNGTGHFLNITNKKDTVKIIEQLKPDIVIHTASITNVDYCENHNKIADEINVKGTLNIVEGCKINKCKLVFLSSSAVFDGTKSEYFEEDITSPVSYYGTTKQRSEEIIQKSTLPHIIIRIDQPYFWPEKWQHSNSVLRVLDALQKNRSFKEITDWYNTPTFIPDITKAIKKLIELNSEGIYHVVGPDFINRYEWSVNVAKIFGLDNNKIIPITSNILNLSAKRANVNLNNKKFQKETKIILNGIQEGLMLMHKKET